MASRASLIPLVLLAAGFAAWAWFALPRGTTGEAVGPWPARVEAAAPPVEHAAIEGPGPVPARSTAVEPPAREAFVLTRGETAVSGRVVDAAGEPVRGALVSAITAPAEAMPLQLKAEAITDASGTFLLRVNEPSEVWIVAASERMRPTHVWQALTGGFHDLAAPLVLEPGSAITGRVLSGARPLAGVELEALFADRARRIEAPGGPFTFVDGRMELARPRARTDDAGRFAFEGLAPGRWTVRAHAFRAPDAAFPPDVIVPEAVLAPSAGVELRIPAATIALEVSEGGRPMPWSDVEIEYGGVRTTRQTDGEGRLEVDVTPSVGLVVVVRAPGRVPVRHLLSGVPRGERREERVAPGVVQKRASGHRDTRPAFRPGL